MSVRGLSLLDARQARAGLFVGAGDAGSDVHVQLGTVSGPTSSGYTLCAVDGGTVDVTNTPGQPLELMMSGFAPALVLKASGRDPSAPAMAGCTFPGQTGCLPFGCTVGSTRPGCEDPAASRLTYQLQDVHITYEILAGLPRPLSTFLTNLFAVAILQEDGGLASGTLTRLSVSGSPGAGYVVAKSGDTLTGITVADSVGPGLIIDGVHDVDVNDVSITRAGADAILVRDSDDIQLSGITATSPSGAGLRIIDSSAVTASGVRIADPGSHGVDASDSDAVSLTNLRVTAAASAASPRSGVRTVRVLPLTLSEVGVAGMDGIPVLIEVGGRSCTGPGARVCDDVTLSAVHVAGTVQPGGASDPRPAVAVIAGPGSDADLVLSTDATPAVPGGDPGVTLHGFDLDAPLLARALGGDLDVRAQQGAAMVAHNGDGLVAERLGPDGRLTVDLAGLDIALTDSPAGTALRTVAAESTRLADVSISGAGSDSVVLTDVRQVTIEGLDVTLRPGVTAPTINISAPGIAAAEQCTTVLDTVVVGGAQAYVAFRLVDLGLDGYAIGETVPEWLTRNRNTPATVEASDVRPC